MTPTAGRASNPVEPLCIVAMGALASSVTVDLDEAVQWLEPDAPLTTHSVADDNPALYETLVQALGSATAPDVLLLLDLDGLALAPGELGRAAMASGRRVTLLAVLPDPIPAGLPNRLDEATGSGGLYQVLVLRRRVQDDRLSPNTLSHLLRAVVHALWFSGPTTLNPIAQGIRCQHGAVLELTAAAAELPVARFRRYARWRIALVALDTLEGHSDQPDLASVGAVTRQLAVAGILRRLREALEDTASGYIAQVEDAVDRLPDDLGIGLLEPDRAIRARMKVLLSDGTRPNAEAVVHVAHHPEQLHALDRLESVALREVEERLASLLEGPLDPGAGSSHLERLDHGLGLVIRDVEQYLTQLRSDLPEPSPAGAPDDGHRSAMEAALISRPRPISVAPLALVLCAIVDGVISLTGAVLCQLLDVQDPQLAIWLPAGTGLLVGVTIATGWALAALKGGQRRVEKAFTARAEQLRASWALGLVGHPVAQSHHATAVRERRTATSISLVLRRARERVRDARALLRLTRVSAGQQLQALRVRLGGSARGDDLTELFGHQTPWYRSLLPASVLAEGFSTMRHLHDGEHTGAMLLQGIWPENGLAWDLPGADTTRIAQTCNRALPVVTLAQMMGMKSTRAQVIARLQAFESELPADLRSEHAQVLIPIALSEVMTGIGLAATRHEVPLDLPWLVVLRATPLEPSP